MDVNGPSLNIILLSKKNSKQEIPNILLFGKMCNIFG
jgi:hypothetical protein